MVLRLNTFYHLHLLRMIMFYNACLGLQYKDNCTTVCQMLFMGKYVWENCRSNPGDPLPMHRQKAKLKRFISGYVIELFM